MSENFGDLEVPGLVGSGNREHLNPNGKSFSVSYPERGEIAMVRPFIERGDMTIEQELARRKDAIEKHRKLLSEYVLPQQLVVLQGTTSEGNKPVLGRITEKLDKVEKSSDQSLTDILKDPKLCKAYKDFSYNSLKLFLKEGILLDAGIKWKEDGKISPSGFFKYSNIMTGKRDDGERVVFVDPDWYSYPSNKGKNILTKAARTLHLAASTALYGSADLAHKFAGSFRHTKAPEVYQEKVPQS